MYLDNLSGGGGNLSENVNILIIYTGNEPARSSSEILTHLYSRKIYQKQLPLQLWRNDSAIVNNKHHLFYPKT